MPTIYTKRVQPSSSSFQRRVKPWVNSMLVIITGFWDDSQPWEDDKIWFDGGNASVAYTRRPSI